MDTHVDKMGKTNNHGMGRGIKLKRGLAGEKIQIIITKPGQTEPTVPSF